MVYSTDDIQLYFDAYCKHPMSIINNVYSSTNLSDEPCPDRVFPWTLCISSNHCKEYFSTHSSFCFGCTMLKRFNPIGLVTPSSFQLKSGKLEGHHYKIHTSPDTFFQGYSKIEEPMDFTEDDWIHRHTLLTTTGTKTSNNAEHIILIYTIIDHLLMSYNSDQPHGLIYYYMCRDQCIYITKCYNYGEGNLNTLINHEYTSYSVGDQRYLNNEVMEAIIYQLYHILYTLSICEYTHGHPSIEYLGFTDEIFNNATRSYSITLHLIPSSDDTIVINGMKYMNKSHSTTPYEDMDDKEWLKHCRNHEGLSLDSGKYEFIKIVNNLKNDKIFSRSLTMNPSLSELLETNKCWDDMTETI